MNMVANPPASFSRTLYYSTFNHPVASANSALLAASSSRPHNRPALNNWDVRSRAASICSEEALAGSRVEAFNFPNRTRISRIDTNGRFDNIGKLANLLFLTPGASRRPRFLNLGLQVSFSSSGR